MHVMEGFIPVTTMALLLVLPPLLLLSSSSAAAFQPTTNVNDLKARSSFPESSAVDLVSKARWRRKSFGTAIAASTSSDKESDRTSTAPTTTTTTITTKKVSPVGRVVKQRMVLDGAEWITVRNRLLLQQSQFQFQSQSQPPAYARTVQGVLTAVTGSIQGQRVVGMQVLNPDYLSSAEDAVPLDQDSSIKLFKESIAEIPSGTSEDLAAWTLLQSLSTVHCALPVVPNVGGSGDSEVVLKDGKVAILGSNPVALTAASALSKLGLTVTVVSMEKPPDLPKEVAHMTPAVGELELGFAAVMDQFDSLLDTLGDEHDDTPGMKGGVTGLLAQRHGCHTYASTLTESQVIVTDSGLLFGPGKTKEHIAKLQKRSSKATATQFPSPVGLGQTVQSLLEKSCTMEAPKDAKGVDVYVRGWSLKDFWEYTRWPRDSSGTNKRYGLPVVEDLESLAEDEDEDGPMISAPPFQGSAVQNEPEISEEDEREAANNPYVMMISGVKGLQEKIVDDQTTCLLFLSAPFCRTCRYLKPQYQRMARRYSEDAKYSGDGDGGDFVFAKAEATGKLGKELGKALGCDSVPSFLLFDKGRMYGKPLAVSRLPSKKLEMAMASLRQGERWDESKFLEEDDEGGFAGGTGRATRGPRKKLY